MDNIVISNFSPGKITAQLSLEDLKSIQADDINNLVKLILKGHNHGIGYDFCGDNLLYDQSKGFSIIDFDNDQGFSEHYFPDLIKLFEEPQSSDQYTDLLEVFQTRLSKLIKQQIKSDITFVKRIHT